MHNEYLKEQNKKQTSIVFSMMVVFMVALDVYIMPGLSFLSMGEFVFICLSPYFLIKCSKIFIIDRKLFPVLIFCIYGFICSVFAMILIPESSLDICVRVVRELFYYIIIFLFGMQLFDINCFKRWMSRLVIFLALFVIVQSVVFYATGFLIPGLIQSAPINDGGYTGQQMYDGILRYASYQGFIKPNGFLCEPSHCAHCFFVYLLVVLFEDNLENPEYILKAVLISIAMAATMSTSAFLELGIAWIAWMIVGKRKKIIHVTIMLVLFLIFGMFVFIRNNDGSVIYVLERFTNLFSDSSTVSNSSSLRVLKGVEIFNSLPTGYQFFGIGFGAYASAVKNGIINSGVRDLSNEYMNSFSYILVSAGILGLTIFSAYFVKIFKTRNLLGKLLIIGLFIMFMGTSIYCTAIYVWMLLLINYSDNKDGLW